MLSVEFQPRLGAITFHAVSIGLDFAWAPLTTGLHSGLARPPDDERSKHIARAVELPAFCTAPLLIHHLHGVTANLLLVLSMVLTCFKSTFRFANVEKTPA